MNTGRELTRATVQSTPLDERLISKDKKCRCSQRSRAAGVLQAKSERASRWTETCLAIRRHSRLQRRRAGANLDYQQAMQDPIGRMSMAKHTGSSKEQSNPQSI